MKRITTIMMAILLTNPVFGKVSSIITSPEESERMIVKSDGESGQKETASIKVSPFLQ
ncbi:hypothetical protein [Ekhidna sp.]